MIGTNLKNKTSLSASDRSQWIAILTINAACFLLALWIFLAFLCYGLSQGKFSRAKASRRFYISGCVTAFITTLVLGMDLTVHLPLRTDLLCDVVTKITVVTYGFSMSSVYVFLWLKQRSLYQSTLLVHLYKGGVVVASYLSLAVLLTTFNACSVLFVAINIFKATPTGCQPSAPFYTWLFVASSAVNASGQAILLWLFVYPFSCARQKPATGSGARLASRSFVITLLCICTDFIAGLVSAFVPDHLIHQLFLMYDVSIAFNVLGVMLTFETWREMLCSPLRLLCKGAQATVEISTEA